MRTVVTDMSLAGFVNRQVGLLRAWLRIAIGHSTFLLVR